MTGKSNFWSFDDLEWISLQAKIEANNMREFSLHPILLATKRCECTATAQGSVNHLEIDGIADIESVKEMVVSEPTQHPYKSDVLYSTCLLMNQKDINKPYLCIYTRPGEVVPGKSFKKEMREWVLTSNGKQKRYIVKELGLGLTNRRKYIDSER